MEFWMQIYWLSASERRAGWLRKSSWPSETTFVCMRTEWATSLCKVRLDEPSKCEKEDARSDRVRVFRQRARANQAGSRWLVQCSSCTVSHGIRFSNNKCFTNLKRRSCKAGPSIATVWSRPNPVRSVSVNQNDQLMGLSCWPARSGRAQSDHASRKTDVRPL